MIGSANSVQIDPQRNVPTASNWPCSSTAKLPTNLIRKTSFAAVPVVRLGNSEIGHKEIEPIEAALGNPESRLAFYREQQDLFVRMLMSGLCVLIGVLAVLVSRRSMHFRLNMLILVVMMCCLKVVMGCCVMMSGSNVMMLTGSVLLFVRHVVTLLKESVFGTEQVARLNPLRLA
jgi:hypothetical protein